MNIITRLKCGTKIFYIGTIDFHFLRGRFRKILSSQMSMPSKEHTLQISDLYNHRHRQCVDPSGQSIMYVYRLSSPQQYNFGKSFLMVCLCLTKNTLSSLQVSDLYDQWFGLCVDPSDMYTYKLPVFFIPYYSFVHS